jgi:hypothetical protein
MKGAGGGKRNGRTPNGRKPGRVESDDRPRGFESTRMRQLWRDIDDAKHKAGLGATPPPEPPSPWDLVHRATALVGDRATALLGDATAWMAAKAPLACALLATGTELLRGVPVVGRLADLVSTPAKAPDAAEPGRPAGERPANGSAPPIIVDPSRMTDPDGGWVH